MQDSVKSEVKKQYARIALNGNSDCCCMPGQCGSDSSTSQAAMVIGYDANELAAIPEASILGVGCAAPLNFANLRESETVVDLGSGAGIDVFLSANKVGKSGKVIGVDMTDEMIDKARANALEHGYSNVEFIKGDIEKEIPVTQNSVDVVVSNCVINLTTSKTDAFRQVYKILKHGGRMVISDLVTDREVEQANIERWCACIDGALTKEHYLASIREAGFENIEVLQERLYTTEHDDMPEKNRKITSVVVRAIKQ